MMKKLSFLLFFLVLSWMASDTLAQSAVYFCTETGAYAYAYGYDSYEQEVDDAAFDACLEYGGTNPVLVVRTDSKGYGAIAIGVDEYGGRVIGAAVAWSTLDAAKKNAKKQCEDYGGKNVEIKHTWNDN